MADHKNLHEALLAFQAEAPTLPKDATNPHFKSKFTPLDTIVETVRPLLAKHGLTWQAFPSFGPNGEPALRYKLAHAATGEVEQDTMPLLLAKNDPQGLGAGLTYARRYSLTAVLNLVSDEDDDGNRASQRGTQRQPAVNGNGSRLLNDEQRARVVAAVEEAGQKIELVLAAVGVESTDDLNADHAKQIRKLLDGAS